MKFSLPFSALISLSLARSPPTVTVKNGTLQGTRSEQWGQDFFLGIPYAQPPLGQLRFRWPQSLNTSYQEVRDASYYGYSCYQYGGNFNLSEDCLSLNVIRPAGYENTTLPILMWIHGGGLTGGSSADPQYNLSGIVKTGADSGNPFIGVSINYRLGVWGFLATSAIQSEGSSNSGLLDQRMAMRWVQENIHAFGGDPRRVTIWGESAGAQSIGFHLHSYDGRNDNLYSAAILESGSTVGASLNALPFYTSAYENLTRTVGCWTSSNQLACLRGLSSQALFRSNYTVVWNPIVDGTFLTGYPASQLAPTGKFVRVPILIGTNTDEGVSFSIKGVDNETALFNALLTWRNYALSPPTIRTLLDLYPNDPVNEPPYDLKSNITFPQYGLQWRRSGAIGGDLVMISGRRKMCEDYVKGGVNNVYSYRFDTPLWNATTPGGIKHFDNVMFSFQNISGALGPLPSYQHYKDISLAIGKAYASFVTSHSPNGGKATVGVVLPEWPQYDLLSPKNIVLNASRSYIENDTWRREGIAFINTVDRELLS